MDDDAAQEAPRKLEFADEPGSGRAVWIGLGLVVALVLWMGSGVLFPADDRPVEGREDVGERVTVAVRESVAEPVTRYHIAEGQTRPDRETAIRAETSGRIASVTARKGAQLGRGAEIARFEVAGRAAQLDSARAALDRAERDFANATELLERGVATADRVANARADLAAAEAALESAEQEFANIVLRAPFDGLLDDLAIDPGEFVSTGTEIGRMLDTDPLTVQVQIPQQAVRRIAPGQRAEVSFITGETREGEVRFVSVAADPETRTFRGEIEVANPDAAIPAGISAQLRIPVGEEIAHFISPALLSLDAGGVLGVKYVDADAVVRFAPVEIVRAQTDGVWVSGLPDSVSIITVGQGFVSAGETVDPRPGSATAEAAQ